MFLTQSARSSAMPQAPVSDPSAREQADMAMDVIVPCFNEREALAQLFEKVEAVETALPQPFQLKWCFVDDGSDDGTWPALVEYADRKRNCTVVRHELNRGLAAAVLTGVAHTESAIVACIDADCTYDPVQLPWMLARLERDVAVVTASPYHPEGGVEGVSPGRLVLSKAASTCYRALSRNKLHTYTSCFRIYRRHALEGIEIGHPRFAGVAELLWHIDQRGALIAEHPAVLQTRRVGRSKLQLAPVLLEHLRLLARCAWQRFIAPPSVAVQRREPSAPPTASKAPKAGQPEQEPV